MSEFLNTFIHQNFHLTTSVLRNFTKIGLSSRYYNQKITLADKVFRNAHIFSEIQ